MGTKLWEKSVEVDGDVERYTVGRDREMDLYLAPYDVLGSMAHIIMLESVGLLEREELKPLLAELKSIYRLAEDGKFAIEDGVEDAFASGTDAYAKARLFGQEDTFRTLAQRSGDGRPQAVHPFRNRRCRNCRAEIVQHIIVAKRTLQRQNYSRIHPPAGGHAVVVRAIRPPTAWQTATRWARLPAMARHSRSTAR